MSTTNDDGRKASGIVASLIEANKQLRSEITGLRRGFNQLRSGQEAWNAECQQRIEPLTAKSPAATPTHSIREMCDDCAAKFPDHVELFGARYWAEVGAGLTCCEAFNASD